MSGQKAIVTAYRHLYRQSLRAIHFSKPARYTLRERLRHAFRKGRPEDFDPNKVANTLEFLRYATAENGLEHKILKNLLYVWWYERSPKLKGVKYMTREPEIRNKVTVYDSFNHNIKMLNESMGMCLPTETLKLPL